MHKEGAKRGILKAGFSAKNSPAHAVTQVLFVLAHMPPKASGLRVFISTRNAKYDARVSPEVLLGLIRGRG